MKYLLYWVYNNKNIKCIYIICGQNTYTYKYKQKSIKGETKIERIRSILKELQYRTKMATDPGIFFESASNSQEC
jgi:hypothetical protein